MSIVWEAREECLGQYAELEEIQLKEIGLKKIPNRTPREATAVSRELVRTVTKIAATMIIYMSSS